jgi:hypothetical protein
MKGRRAPRTRAACARRTAAAAAAATRATWARACALPHPPCPQPARRGQTEASGERCWQASSAHQAFGAFAGAGGPWPASLWCLSGPAACSRLAPDAASAGPCFRVFLALQLGAPLLGNQGVEGNGCGWPFQAVAPEPWLAPAASGSARGAAPHACVGRASRAISGSHALSCSCGNPCVVCSGWRDCRRARVPRCERACAVVCVHFCREGTRGLWRHTQCAYTCGAPPTPRALLAPNPPNPQA